MQLLAGPFDLVVGPDLVRAAVRLADEVSSHDQPLQPLERAVQAEPVVVLRRAAVDGVAIDRPADIRPARTLLHARQALLAVRGVRAGVVRRAGVRVDRAARRGPGEHGRRGIERDGHGSHRDDDGDDEGCAEHANDGHGSIALRHGHPPS
jgi:hypothetical protein